MKYFLKKMLVITILFYFIFVLENFCHLTTNINLVQFIQRIICEEKVPKSPDFKEKLSEIAIIYTIGFKRLSKYSKIVQIFYHSFPL